MRKRLLVVTGALLGALLLSAVLIALFGTVSLSVKEADATGAVLTLQNITLAELTYGADYSLEQLVDGDWMEMEPQLENFAFAAVGYSLPPLFRKTIPVNWETVYGKLAEGDYRLVKQIRIGDTTRRLTAAFHVPGQT